jgi:FlaA1/EpsC-like NDP-sugar epimerase
MAQKSWDSHFLLARKSALSNVRRQIAGSPMNFQNKRVLVTGGDGFIGSHLVEHLIRHGARVTALAQYNSSNYWGWLEDIQRLFIQCLNVRLFWRVELEHD